MANDQPAEYPSIACQSCGYRAKGAHYNIWVISSGGVAGLRKLFGDPPKANEMNFALFSTSGVHGSYTTIEEIEESLVKYGPDPEFMHDGERRKHSRRLQRAEPDRSRLPSTHHWRGIRKRAGRA